MRESERKRGAANAKNDVIQKICVVCGTDISQRKRTKDQHGRYYCPPCWPVQTAKPVVVLKPAASKPVESAPAEALDVTEAPPWEIPDGELLLVPPPLAAPSTVISSKPAQPRVPEPTKTKKSHKIASLIGGIIGIAVCLAVVVGIGLGVRGLIRAASVPAAKTVFAISNPASLNTMAYHDGLLSCDIRLPLGFFPMANRGAGIAHSFEAGGDNYVIKVRATDRDDKTDFKTAALIDRNMVVLSKGNDVIINDEGACTISGRSAYMVNVTGGKKDDRNRSDVVYVDGPDGRMFVIIGEAVESDWPAAQSAIESSISTFTCGP